MNTSPNRAAELFPWRSQLLEAHRALVAGGVLILPTRVGYTMATTAAGVARMKALKGRPEGQPCGLLGTLAVYGTLFGAAPDPLPPEELCLAFLEHPAGGVVPEFVPRACVSQEGRVGVWLNLGPVHAHLANKLWRERRQVIVGTSCNRAGEGNPRCDHYSLAALDPNLRSGVDWVVAIPHWDTPQLGGDGRWLSAPILDVQSGQFTRPGRDMERANHYAERWRTRNRPG
ncbi:MAG: Sua5/YciO/YrdC/YwlC family protein [Cyanobacteriota bacterium]